MRIKMQDVRRGDVDWNGSVIILPPFLDNPQTNRWVYYIASRLNGMPMPQYVNGDFLYLLDNDVIDVTPKQLKQG